MNAALGYEKQLPERKPVRLTAVLSQRPSLEFMIDDPDRSMNQTKDKDQQQDYYSGKNKRHTVTNLVITQRRGKVMFLSDTYCGRVHDKAICDGEEYEFPDGSMSWQDTGFQGFAPLGFTIKQPKKKPRNQSLGEVDKQHIEHHIDGIKRCNIVTHKFRNRTDYFVDDVMEIACGLHNFRREHVTFAPSPFG